MSRKKAGKVAPKLFDKRKGVVVYRKLSEKLAVKSHHEVEQVCAFFALPCLGKSTVSNRFVWILFPGPIPQPFCIFFCKCGHQMKCGVWKGIGA